MRIALFYKQLINVGGAERLILSEAHFLTQLTGHEVPIFCMNANEEIVKFFQIKNIRLIICKSQYPHARLARYLSHLKIGHVISSSGHLDCFLICQLARCSYSLHVHHPIMMSPTDKLKYAYSNSKYYNKNVHSSHESLFLEYQRRILKLNELISISIYWFIYAYVLQHAKYLFVLSAFSQKEKQEMLNCSNAINITGAISSINIDFSRYSSPLSMKKEIKILCLGRLVWDKRFDLVIKSVQLLNEISTLKYKLQIVGSGPHEKELKNLVCTDCVVFYGNVDDVSLDSIWLETDIFCTPDWADFKLTMFESLARGILTIVSDETDVNPDFESSGYLSIVSPDVISLTSKIFELSSCRLNLSHLLLSKALSPLLWSNYFANIYELLKA